MTGRRIDISVKYRIIRGRESEISFEINSPGKTRADSIHFFRPENRSVSSSRIALNVKRPVGASLAAVEPDFNNVGLRIVPYERILNVRSNVRMVVYGIIGVSQ